VQMTGMSFDWAAEVAGFESYCGFFNFFVFFRDSYYYGQSFIYDIFTT